MLAKIDTNMQISRENNPGALRVPELSFLHFSACLYVFGPACWFVGGRPRLQDANPLASWVASCLSYEPGLVIPDVTFVGEEVPERFATKQFYSKRIAILKQRYRHLYQCIYIWYQNLHCCALFRPCAYWSMRFRECVVLEAWGMYCIVFLLGHWQNCHWKRREDQCE